MKEQAPEFTFIQDMEEQRRLENEKRQMNDALTFWNCVKWKPKVGKLCRIQALVVHSNDWISFPLDAAKHRTVGNCIYIYSAPAVINELLPGEAHVTVHYNASAPQCCVELNGLKVRLKLYEIMPFFRDGKIISDPPGLADGENHQEPKSTTKSETKQNGY